MVEYIFFLFLIKRRPKLRLVYMVRWLHFFFAQHSARSKENRKPRFASIHRSQIQLGKN